MNIYELSTMYDARASFYGKAKVIKTPEGHTYLKSYDTNVAVITNDGTVEVKGTYSQTTLRHIKEFLLQHGFKAENKKQILKDYKNE